MAWQSHLSVKVSSHSTNGLIRGDRDRVPLLALGEDLEQRLGAVPVELDVAELVQTATDDHPSAKRQTYHLKELMSVRGAAPCTAPRPTSSLTMICTEAC